MTSFAEVRFPPEISYGATADFEFDVPVRFDTDRLEFRLETHDLMVWEQIPIIDGAPNERLHEEFKRQIKMQCLLPCAETACIVFWTLLASGQITLRKVDGWQGLHVASARQNLDLGA